MKLERFGIRAAECDRMIFLHLDWFCIRGIRRVGVRLALNNPNGIAICVERVETVFHQCDFAARQIDHNLGVIHGVMDAHIGDALFQL
ncbi:MAG: hypothetical protein HIU91_12585 [Acidobacteria bacterium]|nr:hypothetical protein [Acidobacteriota bacterium]